MRALHEPGWVAHRVGPLALVRQRRLLAQEPLRALLAGDACGVVRLGVHERRQLEELAAVPAHQQAGGRRRDANQMEARADFPVVVVVAADAQRPDLWGAIAAPRVTAPRHRRVVQVLQVDVHRARRARVVHVEVREDSTVGDGERHLVGECVPRRHGSDAAVYHHRVERAQAVACVGGCWAACAGTRCTYGSPPAPVMPEPELELEPVWVFKLFLVSV